MGADALSKVSQVGPTNRQRRTGHNRGAIIAEEHATQNRRDVDGRSVQRQKLCGLARALDPVNVLVRALGEEYLNPVARISDSSAQVLQFRLEKLVVSSLYNFGDPRLQCDKAAGNRASNEVRLTHAKLPALPEIATAFHASEKEVDIVDEGCGHLHAGRVAHHGKEALLCPRVVETVDCRS